MLLKTSLLGFLLFFSAYSFSNTIFTPDKITGWKNKSFQGETLYTVIEGQNNDRVLKAESKGSASGLFYEKTIDLNQTPWLSWSWRVDTFPDIDKEQSKPGDDFAARIYVVVKDGWGIWNTKAINYVWSQQHPTETRWPNPFAGERAMMISVENSRDGQWKNEKRNLKEDLKKIFGKEFEKIDAIAIMTDTDNSNSRAVAFYSNITLSKE